VKIIYKKTSPSAKCQRAGNVLALGQDDFKTFCMIDDTKKVYQKLEKVINVC